jgi:AraC-like DNA-binding protein
VISIAVPDSIEALNAGLFVSPGFGTHAVRIIDSWELLFVTQGHLDLFEGNRPLHVQRNQALLLCPGIRHGGLLPYTPDVNFYWAHFRPRAHRSAPVTLAVPKVAEVRDPDGLTELFCRFISDQESGTLDPCSAGHLIALMLATLGETGGRGRTGADGIAGGKGGTGEGGSTGSGNRTGDGNRHRRPGVEPAPGGGAGLVAAVHRYIESEYRKPISTSEVAGALHYNPDYLERVFHGREGISIVDAIHRKRVGMARAALHHDVRRNINEIGLECGYADPGYFRRMFKRITGLTPREFRSLYARTHINTH